LKPLKKNSPAMHTPNQDSYGLLLTKLDQFIRKYYLNQMLRGSLYSTALILGLYLAINGLEYQFYFPGFIRKTLFFSFLGLSGLALFQWIGLPGSRYFRLGKQISHEQAATIIGSHFNHVGDKLLNILQLRQQVDQVHDASLILAGIDQKASEIRLVLFKAAINLNQNRKYLRYALPPLLLLLVLLFAAPSLILDSTDRLIHSGKEYLKPAPFAFSIANEKLEVLENGDFLLNIRVNGQALPQEAFLQIGGFPYQLRKEGPDHFSYMLRNVTESKRFRITGGEVVSPLFELKVLSKPVIQGFEVQLDYPAYTGRKDETFQNTGDLVVPAGTTVDWIFDANHTDDLDIRFEGDKIQVRTATRQGNHLFSLRRKAMRDETYLIRFSNRALPDGDSARYLLRVIPDEYPKIAAASFPDSTQTRNLFLAGNASDDYGISGITFHYILYREGRRMDEKVSPVLSSSGTSAAFRHNFDLNGLDIQPGDRLEYFFEVSDNDAVNGSKTARSQSWTFEMPTMEAFRKTEDLQEDRLQKNLQEAARESRKLQEQMQKLREKLLQQKDIDWQSKKELQRIMDRQKDLAKSVEEARKELEEIRKNQEAFSERPEEWKEKQEKLQELLENALPEEMTSLMEKIRDLLQELNKEEALKMMEQMEFNDARVNQSMERMEELFRQLEMEKEITETARDLDKLSEKQEALQQETQAKPGEKEASENQQDQAKAKGEKQQELAEKQKQLQEEFRKVEEKIEEIARKNEALDKPREANDKREEAKDIQRDMKDSQMNLERDRNDKAAKNQQDAAQKMKELSQQMQNQMQAGQMQQMQVDMRTLRQLLENLVALSFSQEDLIAEFNKTNPSAPRFVLLTQKQNKLKEDFKVAEDTLQALAKRMIQLEHFVTDKVAEVNRTFKEGISQLEERKKSTAADLQQRSMKGLNDLALMLSESLKELQEQMAAKMKGQQMCSDPNSPGEGKPQDRLSQGQEQLNDQMKGKQKEGKSPSARDFAEMAAKQAALRKAMETRQRQRQQQGKGGSQELQRLIEEMNKTEIDLVNKRLSGEIIRRQQQILIRMLEFEKAERMQDQDEQRKAEASRNIPPAMPPALEEYIRQRKAEIQSYQTVSPILRPHYRNLVENYLKSFKPID